ncbi:hypothetical protein BURC_03977 [Burkholderiaceae bacterium]|nr:hypothetical protein BURC_03977 [Burkholderiaceae bacterium]
MRATPASWFLVIVVGIGLAPSSRVLAGPASASAIAEPIAASVVGEVPASLSVSRQLGHGVVSALSDARPKPHGDSAHDMPLLVVEIPASPLPGIGPPRRVHHALSMSFGAAEKAMRSWGIDATDCRLQFRAPTKISQSRGRASIDTMAQLRFGCRF